MEDGTLVWYGSEVKALGNGRVAGYLVLFGDENTTDITAMKDFFQADTDFGKAKESAILYHHGLDQKLGDRSLGDGQLKTDDIGVWIEGQLDLRDEYEKAVYALAEKGKLGWSSGTASHLVRREKRGNAHKIVKWPLGLDASLTPTPAEPRTHAISLKAIEVSELKIDSEESGDGSTGQSTKTTIKPEGSTKMEETQEQKEAREKQEKEAAEATKSTPLNPNKLNEIMDRVADELEAENKKKAMETKAAQEMEDGLKELLNKAMKNSPADNGGGMAVNRNLKTKRGDDAMKALNHFIKTGDNGGLRAGAEYKTDYNLVEGTQYQGQELVPTEVAARIFEMRDKLSIARAAGANVLQVNSAAVNVPYEKVRQGVMVAPGEVTAYDQIEQQIFDKKAITITKYTRNIPISEELIEDSVVDLVPYLTNKAGVLAAQVDNAHFITAATGAWYGSEKGVDAAAAAAIAVTEPIALLHSLNAEYRDNVVWICTKTTEGIVRGLNTAYSYPYIGNGGASGFLGNGGGPAPNAFLGGRMFNLETGMDEIAASKKPLMVGNFQAGYVICERRALTIRRDESAMSTGIVRLLISYRIGGGVVVAEAFKHILTPSA